MASKSGRVLVKNLPCPEITEECELHVPCWHAMFFLFSFLRFSPFVFQGSSTSGRVFEKKVLVKKVLVNPVGSFRDLQKSSFSCPVSKQRVDTPKVGGARNATGGRIRHAVYPAG